MASYINTFFAEKDVPYASWEFETEDGTAHIINNEYVIEWIKKAPKELQDKIADKLRWIDFYNGNVNHFLKYLAEGIVKHY